ncbi:MAG: response regulator transcription factor, partial [Cyanobacteria bacterium J06649_4]
DYSQSADYDLILLDLMLPNLDGISLCKKLRLAQCQAYILMLTARDTSSDKIMGLDAGADDYLVKPFNIEELSARIRALQRRSRELTPQVLQHGNLALNPVTQAVTYGKKTLSLTPKEHLLLEYFMRHPGQVLSRSALLDKLWEFDKASSEGTVKTHLTNLRSKLKLAGSPKDLIETVYGMGYRLKLLDA